MKKQLLILMVALAGALSLSAQSRAGLRLNEVMVINENNIGDEFGNRGAWIELFNSNFAPLEISSVFLTTDPNEPRMYPVPMGDEVTHMGKRQLLLFWADDQPTHGTLHTNFKLYPGSWIGIYDANGITLIDSITIPATIGPDESFARSIDGAGEWEIRRGQTDTDYITPRGHNVINDTNDRVDTFYAKDRHGFALSFTAMCIVFSALLGLCICFMLISKVSKRVSRLNKMKAQGITKTDADHKERSEQDSGEVIAAIAMALRDHLNAHDTEKTVLTINKVKKAYSPWSSKIYSMREMPRRK